MPSPSISSPLKVRETSDGAVVAVSPTAGAVRMSSSCAAAGAAPATTRAGSRVSPAAARAARRTGVVW